MVAPSPTSPQVAVSPAVKAQLNKYLQQRQQQQLHRTLGNVTGVISPTGAGAGHTDDPEKARRDQLRREKDELAAQRLRAQRSFDAHQEKLRDHSQPDRVRSATRAEWIALFLQDGADVIYNAIATGHTIASFGRERGFPLHLFKSWCDDNLDRKELLIAQRAAAELAAYDSVAVFDDPGSSASMQAVHHVRAKAHHKAWTAERRDAEQFGPPKAVPPQAPPAALNVYIDASSIPPDIAAQIADKRAAKLAEAAPVFNPATDKVIEHTAEGDDDE